jgi:hypothetical protein
MTERLAVSRKNFSLAMAGTMLPGTGMASQAVRRGAVQGTGVRRILGEMQSSASDPGNFPLVLAIILALAVLIVLIILTVREFFLWRRESADDRGSGQV